MISLPRLHLRCLCPSADYTKGFGGKFGVETDKVDKSAVGFEYQGKTERHESQKGQYHDYIPSQCWINKVIIDNEEIAQNVGACYLVTCSFFIV